MSRIMWELTEQTHIERNDSYHRRRCTSAACQTPAVHFYFSHVNVMHGNAPVMINPREEDSLHSLALGMLKIHTNDHLTLKGGPFVAGYLNWLIILYSIKCVEMV